ncbi:MAG: carboxylesterase family protein [Clostridia bacterium]|nr:carboxylesterase family protein [Clostridia bacterium]
MKHRFILTLLAVALSLAMIGCNTHVIAARAEGFNELKPPEEVKAELNAGYGENKPITDDNYDRALAVKCNNGTFVGKETDELIIWKGIPYATQPLGKLRWQKALPASDDDGVYDATEPGHIPIGPVNDSEGTAEFGEDCLVLNIYCNTSCTDSKKPVMVWIHGGGFCAESQASPLYDLTNISKQYPDILFVSIDYRLGFLGFMNFERVPGGENFKDAGNLGLLDQLESLRWVQKNIAGFGGDPDNVTIFGESAGSASVTLLPLIDGSEGLFRRIIAQSANIAYCDTMEHGIHVTQNFLTATGCQTMDELMALTTEELVDAYAKASAIDMNCLLGTANFPLLDGVTLPEDRTVMYEMWGDEKRAGIDLMIGSNQDEIRYFIPGEGGEEGFANTLRWIARKDRTLLSDQEKAMYDEFMATLSNESELSRLEQYCNDLNFRAGNTDMAIRHSAAGGNTYMYFVKKPVITPELGVMHATEIPYLFDTWLEDPMGSGEIVGIDECEFRHVVKEMWANFARTGNPSTDQYEWKKFSGDDRQTMVFDDTIGMQVDLFGRREDLMMSWAERLGNGSSKRVC